MIESAEYLLMGSFLGFAAGISPGPLLALVISETLQHGPGEGIKVAFSPLITDVLIVSSIVLVLMQIEGQDLVIGLISLLGALYLVHLGLSSFKVKTVDLDMSNAKKDSLKKGIIANFLSPHPYMFWIAIGAPVLIRALDIDILVAVMFVAGFYIMFVIAKVLVALFVGRCRSLLTNNYYLYTIRSLGVAYFVFALFFVREGLELVGLM